MALLLKYGLGASMLQVLLSERNEFPGLKLTNFQKDPFENFEEPFTSLQILWIFFCANSLLEPLCSVVPNP